MKKVYTLLAIAAVALNATAAIPTAVTAPAVKAITAVPKVKAAMRTQTQSRLHFNGKLDYTPQDRVYFDGDEVWTSIGTGKITSPFFEIMGYPVKQFDVEIEETPIEGGRKFRCLPFSMEDNTFYELGLNYVDTENYMVFYAMDNGKNYFEDFTAYGYVPFSQFVEEMEWEGGNAYATFDGETWTVPVKGVLGQYSAIGYNSWYMVNTSTPLTIALPGAKDYSAAIQTWICGEDIPNGVPAGACQAFLFQGAADAAYVKYGFLSGHWDFTMEMAEFAGLYGAQVASGNTWRCGISEDTEPGIYTAYVATFDAEDNCKDIKSSYFFVLDDDQDNWVEAGTATWNESLYAGSYNNWPTQELTVVYEEHKDMPGYIRLVNPYADATKDGVSLSAPCEGHNHYIYIDATQPEYVKIEPSVTGGAYDGRGVVMSNGYKFENSGIYEAEEIKAAGFYGTLVDNKITFPDKDVIFGEKGYQNGAFLSTSVPFEVTLTPKQEVAEPTITLDQTEATVKVGETVTLTATVENQPQTDEVVTWTSSDEAIATVDSEGVVTGVAEGTATITASIAGVSATCVVTVEKADEPDPDVEVWTSLGTGKITSAFFEMFGIAAEKYDVEIEETPIEGGRKFRCLPFSMENNPFYNFGITDVDTENYMVFYAMEDGKSYFEDFVAYDIVPFTQYVEESDWEGGDKYATFDGETWTVPVQGVLAQLSALGYNGWYYGNGTTPLTITLPGAKDYTATIQTWICGEDIPDGAGEGNCQAFLFSGAADAAGVKFGYLPGYWNFTMEMAEFVAEYGTEVEAGKVWNCGVEEGAEPGMYTAYVATFDEDGNCKDIKSSYFFVLDDDQDNWVEAGTATWKESLYSGSYNNWEPQELTMVYEEHKDMPGYIRLVNPYAEAVTSKGESLYAPCEGHNHYIYIDATNSEQVKIEPSVTGGAYDGRGVVMSNGYHLEYAGMYDPEEIKAAGFYGTLADNKITFPVDDVVFGEKGYQNGAFLATSVPFEVVLTPKQEVVEPTITLDQTEATVKVGETVTLTATVEGNPMTDEAVTWTSSDEAIATVDSEGVVTGVAEGTATITASIAGVSATCTVTVVAGGTDILSEIKAAAARGELYDLQGRRVGTAAKGIVILRQGSKVVKMNIK